MKNLYFTILAVIMVVGIIFPNLYGSVFDTIKLGATSFPTSLDSFTNPSATDSVATVSHSGQHSDANDAIEAVEAKVGITASTPTANTVFFGNGAGSSIWSATPSLSTLTLTGLGTFGGFISTASSTVNAGLTITGNSTTTNATTTIGAFTGHATSTNYRGGGLTSCQTGNFLTWDSGLFGCETDQVGSLSFGNATGTPVGATTFLIATSTVISAGQTVMVWANADFKESSNKLVYLTVKPPTAATSTLNITHIDNPNDISPISLHGSWLATETGTHKFVLWDNVAGGGLAELEVNGWATTSIMFLNLGG